MKYMGGGSGRKQIITRAEYLQLLGLFVLHKRAEAHRRSIEMAVAELVGEPSEDGGHYFGHVSDSLFDKTDVEGMLEKLEITVEDNDA